MFLVRIQHDQSTRRFHPAYYRLAPLPGGVDGPDRYKSGGHHTAGFHNLPDAQAKAAELAASLPFPVDVPPDGFPVREMAEAGADVLILDPVLLTDR